MELEKIKKALEEKINELGYELYSLTYKRIKGDNILEIIIDRVKPIDMDTIIEVSKALSNYLDELDIINEAYLLDVSSLGAEKPIKTNRLKDYVGQYVNLHLNHPYNGENIIEGTIKMVDDKKLTLTYKIKTRQYDADIDLDNILKARLAIKF